MAPITTHPCQHVFYFLFLLFYNYLFDEVRSNLSAPEIGIFLKAEDTELFFSTYAYWPSVIISLRNTCLIPVLSIDEKI